MGFFFNQILSKVVDELRGSDTVIYIDQSNMVFGIDTGYFSDTPSVAESYSLPAFDSIFQAEVQAIVADYWRFQSNIIIMVYSPPAIEALYMVVAFSRLMEQWRDALNRLGDTLKATLRWGLGHENIPGDDRTDKLTW